MNKECPCCKKIFETKNCAQIYCSKSCKGKEKARKFRKKHGHYKYSKEKVCIRCGKTYKETGGKRQKYCSRKCANLARKKFLDIPQCLEEASRKLDKTIGYVRVYCPMHPHANTWGYVYEHRLIMEGILGRILEKNEHVHHKNGKRWDNRPENLEVLSASEHMLKTQKELKEQTSPT